jgi:hypothetical protein
MQQNLNYNQTVNWRPSAWKLAYPETTASTQMELLEQMRKTYRLKAVTIS